jgi:hypothetical protein
MKLALPTIALTVAMSSFPTSPSWASPFPGVGFIPQAASNLVETVQFRRGPAATAYVGQPPAPGYCWYYTNLQRTQGFWDVCPR